MELTTNLEMFHPPQKTEIYYKIQHQQFLLHSSLVKWFLFSKKKGKKESFDIDHGVEKQFL